MVSQHALQVVFQHALQQVSWGVWYPSMPCRSPGGSPGPHPEEGGKLRGLAKGSPGPHPGGGGSPGPHPVWSPGPNPEGGMGGCVSQNALRRPPPPPVDGYCRGRYASYWNAFLFHSSFTLPVDEYLICLTAEFNFISNPSESATGTHEYPLRTEDRMNMWVNGRHLVQR